MATVLRWVMSLVFSGHMASTFVAMNSMMNLFWTFKCRVRISRTLRKNECRKTKRHDHPSHHRQIDLKYLLVYGHLPSGGMFTSSAKCRTGVRTLWQDLLTPILPIVGNPRVILIDSLRTQTHGLRWWYYLMNIELFFVIVHVISNLKLGL